MPGTLARPDDRPRKRGLLADLLRCWQLYVLVAPTIIYLFIFNYIPMYGMQIAFRDFIANRGVWGSQWVGIKHFRYFFTSPQFAALIGNTIKLSVYSLLWSFPFPILLALMLNEARRLWFKKLIQNLTYIPYFISVVVLVSMVNLFLAQGDGLINQAITALGGQAIDFLGKERYFRTIYIASGVWQGMGWSSIIYLAALSNVDIQLHEAAQIDGATRLQRVWHINIPCILPTAIILFILSSGHIMTIGFEKVYLLQNTLNTAISEVISTYVYKTGLLNVKYSYTAAIGLFNNVINILILLTVNKLSQKLSDISLF
jgi:putative aldouronate transport system permease protein